MERFQNKYRIPSARLQNWDYGRHAAYFVTICTARRQHYFGDIVDGIMQLSAIGEMVNTEWLKTFEMRPDMNLTMDEYIIMPNHFHAIIIIGENEYNNARDTIRTDAMRTNTPHTDAMQTNTPRTDALQTNTPRTDAMQTNTPRTDAMHCVSTNKKNQFGPQSKNLASIIRGFKIGVTKNARQIHADFAWQSRYHDHIIRNDASHNRIKQYIINNPANWDKDKFCP